jgi:signal transduction histidine kinase
MKMISADAMLEAAAYALVGERCRQSYIHDIRGGLQALHSAIELLTRAARTPGENERLADKAATLARRTLANYENMLVELMSQVTPHGESDAVIEVGAVVNDVLQFVRNDASAKSVVFRLQAQPGVFILAPARKFRLLLVGLCSATIDELAAGAVVDVVIARRDMQASIEFSSAMRCPALPSTDQLWRAAGAVLPLYDLLLVLTRRWACASGGALEVSAQPGAGSVVLIRLPVSPTSLEAVPSAF